MARFYVFLAPGFEEIEALATVDILRRAGIEVITASTQGKTVRGSHGIAVEADELAENLTDEFDGVILPGGMPGTLNLEKNGTVQRFLKLAYENGKYLCAICAAPSVLGHAGYLSGKKAVCYPGFEKELTGAEVIYEPVCADGRTVTSRGAGTAVDFALKITELVCSPEKSAELRKGIIYGG